LVGITIRYSYKFVNHNQTFIPYFDVRSHDEIFIRRTWYSVLPSLYATISCRIKKAVVGATQLITALVSIHSSMTILAGDCNKLANRIIPIMEQLPITTPYRRHRQQ